MPRPKWMEMRGEWGDLLDKAGSIVSTAVNEGRAMTADERQQYRATVDAARGLMAEIINAEAADGIQYVNGVRTDFRDYTLARLRQSSGEF